MTATPLTVTPAEATTNPATTKTTKTATSTTSAWKPRPAQYSATSSTKDLAIPMSDGVKLRGDLTLPANADGTPIGSKVPVIVTITAYNKTVIAGGFGGTLAGADPAYLVKRGYAQLTVDARGTGSSEGQWNAFDKRENKDASEVMTWAHKQPWSNGNTAMTGASYMGIGQIFAAAGRPAGLKAIFPQVPAADVYRDVTASGGQIDSGFMPLWLGLVTATGLIPPAVATKDPQSAIGAMASRIGTATTFTGPTLVKAIAGQDTAYDGPFYAERSPINVISKVNVPTFLIGGEYDLFQRGTPLLYENLRKRGIPTKMIIGPWDHLKGSSGAEVGQAGYGPLNELQLRWFDHYVKGKADPTLDSDIAPMTYYEQGTGAWRKGTNWVGSDRSASSWRLSGSASNGTPGALTTTAAKDGTATVLPIPVAGLCTRSTNQWTAGVMGQNPLPNPCLDDNRINDLAGVTFDSAPVKTAGAVPGTDQRAALRLHHRRKRNALGRRRGRRARRHRQAPHRRLAGHLAPSARHLEVALPRRQADPGVPPIHARRPRSHWLRERSRRSMSRSSRPAPRSSRVTGCGSRFRPSTCRTCRRRCPSCRDR